MSTVPQNHCMAEVERDVWSSSGPTPQAGSHRDSCPGPCPDGFGLSPRMETPELSCATCGTAK